MAHLNMFSNAARYGKRVYMGSVFGILRRVWDSSLAYMYFLMALMAHGTWHMAHLNMFSNAARYGKRVYMSPVFGILRRVWDFSLAYPDAYALCKARGLSFDVRFSDGMLGNNSGSGGIEGDPS